MGGMFAASGPVIGWFGYSQPLPLPVIRATLLASFGLTTSARTVMVAAQGELTQSVVTLSLLGLPAVLLGTWLGRAFRPPVSDDVLKRGAFGVLLAMGLWILVSAF